MCICVHVLRFGATGVVKCMHTLVYSNPAAFPILYSRASSAGGANGAAVHFVLRTHTHTRKRSIYSNNVSHWNNSHVVP